MRYPNDILEILSISISNNINPHSTLNAGFTAPLNVTKCALYKLIICPIAIAGTDYKIGLRLSVCVCVCLSVRLRALSRSHFLIDFHKNWHRRKNPEK